MVFDFNFFLLMVCFNLMFTLSYNISFFYFGSKLNLNIPEFKTIESELIYKIDYLTKKLKELCATNGDLKIDLLVDSEKDPEYAFAYFSKEKSTIIIGSWMLKHMNLNQLSIVLAHEFFHIKEKHSLKNNILMIGICFSSVFFFSILYVVFCILFLKNELIIRDSVVMITFIYLTINFLINFMVKMIILPITKNVVSHKNEYSADLFSAKEIGISEYIDFISFCSKWFKDDSKSINLFRSHPSWNERFLFVLRNLK